MTNLGIIASITQNQIIPPGFPPNLTILTTDWALSSSSNVTVTKGGYTEGGWRGTANTATESVIAMQISANFPAVAGFWPTTIYLYYEVVSDTGGHVDNYMQLNVVSGSPALEFSTFSTKSSNSMGPASIIHTISNSDPSPADLTFRLLISATAVPGPIYPQIIKILFIGVV